MLIVTSTVPAASGGEVTVHEVVEAQRVPLPPVGPNTAVVALTTNPVPVTVTTTPPPNGPAAGAIPVSTGPAS